ncbi:MAG: acyltransferase family protein, partial [Actinomycetes bacterium]
MSRSTALAERPPAPEVLRKRHLRTDVQGLRAIAVLVVVAFHAGLPIPGGFIGVDVFFVISGFVISSMFIREREVRGSINWKRFYSRRFRRLLPALAVATSVTAIIAVFLQSAVDPFGGQKLTAKTGLGATFFVANAVLYRIPAHDYFGIGLETDALLNTWSLSVEEQFYVIFPLLMIVASLLAYRYSSRWKPLAAAMAVVVAVVSLVLCIVLTFDIVHIPGIADSRGMAFYSPFTRAWEFAFGAFIAFSAGRLALLPRFVLATAGWVGFAVLAFSLFSLNSNSAFPGFVALLPVVAAMLMIIAGAGGYHQRGDIGRYLSTPPMTWIGDRSYSWYLWHWPLIVFAAILLPDVPRFALVAAVFSLFPAALAYRYVENPIRRRTPANRLETVRLIATCMAVPTLLLTTLWVGATTGWGSPTTRSLQATVHTNTAGETRGCITAAGLVSEATYANCTWPVPDSKGTILLFGDSHAEALSNAVIGAGNRLGYTVTSVSLGGCPLVTVKPDEVYPSQRHYCGDAETNTHSVERAIADPGVKLVVTTQNTTGYIRDLDRGARDRWFLMSAEPLQQLEKAGVPVLWVGDVPEIGVSDVACWYGLGFGPRCYVSREQADRYL